MLTELRDLIEERTGLFFRDGWGIEVLEDRLKPRLEKTECVSFAEYNEFLSGGGEAAMDEWMYVIAELAKSTSSFHRHWMLTQVLVDKILPQRLSNGETGSLNIWSAGCATGEEPLAIAIALSEAGWFDRVEIDINASDANFAAIEKARQGLYHEYRIRHLEPELRSKYFVPAGEEWQAKPELVNRINWSVANLANENEIAPLAASDIIFCRNIFIYFSESAILKTLNLFAKYMQPGGYLFTDEGDHFESLISGLNLFDPLKLDGVTVWRKWGKNLLP